MIPPSDWRTKLTLSEEVQWVASRPGATFYDCWEQTTEPGWLIHLAIAGGATQKSLILTACAVARLCLHCIHSLFQEERGRLPRFAIETTEAWTRGEATAEQVEMARQDVWKLTNYGAIYDGAAFAANATTRTITDSIYNAYTFNTVYHTLRAGVASQLICATIRKHLPWERPPRPKGLTIWQRLAEVGDE